MRKTERRELRPKRKRLDSPRAKPLRRRSPQRPKRLPPELGSRLSVKTSAKLTSEPRPKRNIIRSSTKVSSTPSSKSFEETVSEKEKFYFVF
jgi:hypothetical protein